MRDGIQTNSAYQNVPSEAYWPVPAASGYKPQAAKSSRKKWFIIGGSILGALALIGIIVGVVESQKGKNAKSASSSKSSDTGATTSDSNDPSDFQKDSRLHQSFWGFAYTPNAGGRSVMTR